MKFKPPNATNPYKIKTHASTLFSPPSLPIEGKTVFVKKTNFKPKLRTQTSPTQKPKSKLQNLRRRDYSAEDMVGKKKSFLKRLKGESLRWKYLAAAAFKWKRLAFPTSFFNDVAFKILSLFEAVFLVLTACFFYLMCGCRF